MFSLFFVPILAVTLGPISPEAPAREPQIAANESMVGVTFGAGNAIYFSVSHDTGQTFSSPVKVAEASVVPLSRHRGPRIVFSGEAIVISAVAGKTLSHEQHAHGLPSDGDLVVWRSVDGGKNWSKGIVVNDAPGAPTEGLHSLAADARGNLFAAWLDKRGGNGTKLYGARSTDGGATWSKNVLIYESPDGTICQCCHPSVAIAPDGQILVMWRNWRSGSRDMYLARSRDGVTFSKPEKLGTGTWPLNACPMDGGGLGATAAKTVTAWRRGENVFLAEPGKPEEQIGSGKDVALALSGGHAYVTWTNGTKIEAWSGGQTEVLSNTGSFSALASLPGGGALAAWEENGAIVTRRLPQVATANIQQIQARFVSPCCWRENLAVHDSPIAEEMRAEVARLAESGQSESQIVDYYVALYGERILREPRGVRFQLLTITPIAALGIGGLCVVRFLTSARQHSLSPAGAAALPALPEDELESL
jgi:cytochrome c-type biogenesis protein CcmH/NrfF